ncbi:hypothetical protein CRX72_00175 [Pantoea sp. BRM17]|nr:hypothetical protein CRX72_00175 [Pantoea sp. BRM17]
MGPYHYVPCLSALSYTPAAQSNQAGGFKAGEASVVTVKQAEEMKDDSWITVRGTLEKQTGDEDYLFRDSSGTMKVEIDHKRLSYFSRNGKKQRALRSC